jgi:hypothetical protein
VIEEVVRTVLRVGVKLLREDRALAADVRAVLGVPTSAQSDSTAGERVQAFATRIGVGERTVWQLVRSGMPTIGRGRSRRIDVQRALDWLRHRERPDDVIELDARRRARQAADRMTRR